MRTKASGICMIAALLLTSVYTVAQTCTSGDCQPGVIAGPYSAPLVAGSTFSNFPVCKSAACTTGWPTRS